MDFCALENAVFADLQAHLLGDRADRDVMLLGASEINQPGAELVRVQKPHIHLDAALQNHGRFGLALGQYLADFGIALELFHHRLGVFARDQDVNIADGLEPPAQAARDFDLLHAFALFSDIPPARRPGSWRHRGASVWNIAGIRPGFS